MRINVRLFSHVRHQLGAANIELELPNEASTGDIENAIRRMLPETARALPFRIAVNQSVAQGDVVVAIGDEVAVLPPMQGG